MSSLNRFINSSWVRALTARFPALSPPPSHPPSEAALTPFFFVIYRLGFLYSGLVRRKVGSSRQHPPSVYFETDLLATSNRTRSPFSSLLSRRSLSSPSSGSSGDASPFSFPLLSPPFGDADFVSRRISLASRLVDLFEDGGLVLGKSAQLRVHERAGTADC